MKHNKEVSFLMYMVKFWKCVIILHFWYNTTYGETTTKSNVLGSEKSTRNNVEHVFISQTQENSCNKHYVNGYNEGEYVCILPARNSIKLLENPINPDELYYIAEILNPSREYEIYFQMTVKEIPSTWSTILLFTADSDSNNEKYGDRSPLISMVPGTLRLHTSQSTTVYHNPTVDSSTSLGINVERCIEIITEDDEVRMYIDGVLDWTLPSLLSTRPQLGKLDVYYGDPFHDIPNVILNHLSFTPLPKESWDWITCAKECASNNECEFWTLSLPTNACKLMKNKGTFHEDNDYLTGESDEACHNICSLGFVVELRIFIPENPQFISWQVRKENEIRNELLQPYSESSESKNYYHEICIEKGVYEFTIQNSDGSGLVGYEPPIGSHRIMFKNQIVAEGNPYFGYHDSFRFGICESDIDCEVDDSCIIGSCNNSTNICHFQKLRCADCFSGYDGCNRNINSCIPSSCVECGLHTLDIEVRTDWNPDNILWEVTDQYGISVFNSSGKFQNWRYEQQSYSTCLGDGTYLFNIYSKTGLGLSDGIKGWYKIIVNDLIIQEGGASDNFVHENVTISSLCRSDTGCNDDNPCTNDYCDVVLSTCYYEQSLKYHKECGIFGDALALAIRVEAEDSQTTSSEREISDYFYGTYGKSLTMTSQFSACSYNQFNTFPFNTSSYSGKHIANGVISISLEDTVRSKSADTVANMVLNVASSEYGDIESQFDFVMLCLPPGVVVGTTEFWKAYAFVGSYLSIYNDGFCNSPSVQMHELGHNFGLSHSNDVKNYGDESGYMGMSYSNLYGPKKCFNGPKTWQLGWLSNGHYELDSRTLVKYEEYKFALIGISSYEERADQSTIIKLINSNDGYDYYISFNTNTSMNAETGEGINQVLITKRLSGTMFEDSYLIGKLDISDSFALFGFDNENDIFIIWHGTESGNIAYISIGKANIFCSLDTDCDDLNPCSIDTCNDSIERGYKVCNHSPVECTICGNAVDVQVYTSNAPEQIVWDIKDINSNRIVRSSGYFTEQNSLYSDRDCLAYGTYVFSISYGEHKGFTLEDFDFAFYVGNTLMDEGNVSEATYVESFFIICTADIECKDYDGCSVDICNTTSKLCENTLQENNDACTNCSWIRLNITTDNYPVETSWEILATDEKKLVISGQPYAFDLSIAFGRSKAPTRAGRSKAPTKNGRSKAPTRTSRLLAQSNPYRYLNENKVISEELCLENDYTYYFEILDSFGDGICCSEGRGSYFLTLKDHVLLSGGDFSYSESLVFKPMLCVGNSDCDDDDITTEDICILETNVCIYRSLDCSAYGVITTVKMFSSPQLMSWTLESSSSSLIILSDGPYSDISGDYEKVECLPFGTYKITFYDLGKNVTRYCGAGENCGYILKANDIIIPQQNKVFAKDEIFYFGLCQNDADCFDGDSCTVDKCDAEKKICSFSPLPCMECSNDPCNPAQSCLPSPCAQCATCNVVVEITTDMYPQDTKWKIINNETQIISLLGQAYSNLYTDYKHHDCISEGAYKLIFTDFVGNGLSSCWEGNKCGYKLYLDQILIKEERDFFYETETSFSCVAPSLSQKASPCTQISSNLPANDTWTIIIDETLGYSSVANDLTLNYCISEGKNISQLRTYIYDEACSVKSRSKAITVLGTMIEKTENSKLDLGKISIELNETMLRESPFCINCTANEALVSFCVRTELLLFVDRERNFSVSFAETKVKSHINFLSGFTNFEINETKLIKSHARDAHSETKAEVNACICDGSGICVTNPKIKQNDDFSVCVYSRKSKMQVSRFESVIFYQDGIAKFILAENGEVTNDLSKLHFESGMASFTTRLISVFFQNPEPSNVIIFGEVMLKFKQKRRLNIDIQDNVLKMDNQFKGHFNLELRISNSYFFTSRSLVMISIALSMSAALFSLKRRKEMQTYIIYSALQTKEF